MWAVHSFSATRRCAFCAEEAARFFSPYNCTGRVPIIFVLSSHYNYYIFFLQMATGMCFDRPPHAPLSMSLLATISASWSQREIPRPPSAQCIIVKCHLNEDDKADTSFVTQECTQLDLSWRRQRADQSFIIIRVANLYRMLIWMSRQFRWKYESIRRDFLFLFWQEFNWIICFLHQL